MLDVILIAANLWLCPGGVYTDHPGQGCKEVQESDAKGGVSRIPEAPGFDGSSNPTPVPSVPQSSGASPKAQSNTMPAASAQECALYDEYLKLSMKSGSIGARDLSPTEFERWRNLQQIFATGVPPVCAQTQAQ